MRKIIIFLLIILNITSVSVRASAISAQSAVLIDKNYARILYEKNAHEKLPMASTTKIMTALLACESGKMKEIVTVSAFASGTEGSSLWLKVGEKLTLEELTYGLMLKSGNDAAVAIAEYLGGSVDAFALMMTQRAKELGAKNTSFKNPHGLDAQEHYTTAYDLALIAREAMKNEKFAQIVSTKNYTIPMQGEKWDRALKNHNKMLWRYDGCNGIKTGFTKKCGRCLVTSAKKDDEEFICVTLNAPDDWSDHTTLLDYGFENYETENVIKKGDKVTTFTYDTKNNRSVKLIAKRNCFISVGENDEIETGIEYTKLEAPAPKGSVGGFLCVICNGEEVDKIELVTAQKIKKFTLKDKIKQIFNRKGGV